MNVVEQARPWSALAPDADTHDTTQPAESAWVRVALGLRPDELETLHAALEQHFHRPLQLEITLDPNIIGGVHVRVGDTVIDGSLRGKIEVLRHHLRVQSRVMVAASESLLQVEGEGDG